jgi:hypothetical protein
MVTPTGHPPIFHRKLFVERFALSDFEQACSNPWRMPAHIDRLRLRSAAPPPAIADNEGQSTQDPQLIDTRRAMAPREDRLTSRHLGLSQPDWVLIPAGPDYT